MNPDIRRHDLDAVRAFALLLGVVFHASLSFVPFPIGWTVMDVSTSPAILIFILVSHSFRMPLFFLIAGFFSRMAFHARGAAPFLKSRFVRLMIPFAVGWWILWPLTISAWMAGGARMRGEPDMGKAVVEGFASMGNLSHSLYVQTHLWFLYYLAMITFLSLGLRLLLGFAPPLRRALGQLGDKLAQGLGRPWGVLMLALPTALILWFMRGWGMDTPDKSLVPHIPVLLLYGSAFLMGWMLHRNRTGVMENGLHPGWIRWTLLSLSLAGTLWLSGFQADPGHPQLPLLRAGFVLSYALMMWSLVFLTIALFRRWMSRSRAWVRYLADASYWIYLLHLPLVVWLQVAVSEWPLPWLAKWGLISLITIGISLLAYDLFVRSTRIGVILNGRRRERFLRIG